MLFMGSKYRYFTGEVGVGLTTVQLRIAKREIQLKVMREWFNKNFDTLDELPYDSEEGGYQFIWGGPFDARDELEHEFSGIVPDDVIDELANTLEDISSEWSGKPYDDDYLYEFSPSELTIHDTFQMSLYNTESLLSLEAPDDLKKHLHRLCFANVITALETYLADTFMAAVKGKAEVLERFVESTPEFKKEKFPFSEVFKRSREIDKKAGTYLSGVLWHNLFRVKSMYKATLSVEFPADLDSVQRAIVDRHDIVHRSGKSKDGKEGSWGEKEVRELIKSVSQIVTTIEEQVNKPESVTSTPEYPFEEI
jgi:hypothetical protein